jgi:hypothetical protein
MILCIDPGSRKAGVALFETDGLLMTAWLAEGKDWKDTADSVVDKLPINAARITVVVVEKMQIYNSTPLAHANDCVTLSLMAGRVTGLFSGWIGDRTYAYYPHQWKGQVPKRIMIERIKKKLTPGETSRIKLPKAAGKKLDVWDAVGIGLYHLRKERSRFDSV